MKPKAIHQFSVACSSGDGVSSGMFLIQRLLRSAGVESEIYCEGIPPDLTSLVCQRESYVDHPEHILLIHHCIGNVFEGWLKQLESRCFMIFHNITPAEFFAAEDPIQPMLAQGWEQLKRWPSWIEGVIADSRKNLEVVLEYGYDPQVCVDIPLLVDLDKFEQTVSHGEPVCSDADFSLLFVGRLMQHKNQAGLVLMLQHLRQMTGQDVHLTLVGGHEDKAYVESLLSLVRCAGLEGCVRLTGKLSDAELAREFQSADLYVSLSQHEGFGMPLIESMAAGLPVLAYSSPDSNVEHTLGGAGFLLRDDGVESCAAVIAELMGSPRLRAKMLEYSRQHLQSFSLQRLFDQLLSFLERFDIQIDYAELAPEPLAQSGFRIEGPFDSSYSLAIVNRELARALNRRTPGSVALHSTEGPGDFAPNPDFLASDAECRSMHAESLRCQNTSHTLRLLYPPRVKGMKGLRNGISCYGWEESMFPSQYVRSFNQHLQFVTSMSSYVSRTLIDNGVRCPIETVGIGADHILSSSPIADSTPELKAGLVLLHVSSCFPRKGVDCLLESYGHAFSATDQVTLVLKTFPNQHHDIERQLDDWRRGLSSPPDVLLINKDLGEGEIRALYLAADALVAPSRGEGFGLPMAEAMLHDCAVITTAYGGQTDFCTDDTAWLIDYKFARAGSHMGESASVWVEPLPSHLSALLQEFYAHYQAGDFERFSQAKVSAARSLIERQYTWDAVAARLHDFLEADEPELLDPTLKFGIVTSWNSKCGIATYSRLLVEPALSECLVFANDDAELTLVDGPRVKRCWTAGQEDSLERLRDEILLAGLDQVLIQFNFSFFSLSALNDLLNTLFQHNVQVFITFHSTEDVYWGDELKTLRDLCPALEQATRLFVHSVDDLNRLKTLGLVNNTTLFPHGVAVPKTVPSAVGVVPEEMRHYLKGKTVIASYGFLLPHKGIRELIEAFARLTESRDDLYLLLVNACYPVAVSQQEAASCRHLIDSLGLAGSVSIITDYLEDTESLAWLSLADVIVFPYQHTQESSSAAVRWGLATGKPVLCTPLSIFEDVASAVNFLPGTGPLALCAGIQDWLAVAGDNNTSVAQQQWLEQHDWCVLSERLSNQLMALKLNNSSRRDSNESLCRDQP